MRQMISRLLRGSQNAVDLAHLTKLVRRYAVEQQQVPKDLVDLVALKYLAAVPTAPPGQKFVIDRKKAEVRLEAFAAKMQDNSPVAKTPQRDGSAK